MSPPPPPPPILYFAYGSNLSLVQMHARCPTSSYLGIGILHNWTWIINARGYANIIPSPPPPSPPPTSPPAHTPQPNNPPPPPTSLVYGLIYTLTPTDEALLDGYEGVPYAYTKEMLPVEMVEGEDGGKVKKVLGYVDRVRVEKGTPREEYVLRMQRGCAEAREKGVPVEWMERVMGEYFPLEGEEEEEGG